MAKRLQELYLPGKDIRDFAIYQTWRAISPPPQDNIFAFCEYPAVTREDFRTVKSIMGPDEIPSNVYYMEMAQHSPRHKWYYFDNLSPDEVIIFKGWDSRAPYSILHSSVNKSVANANPRVSLESRHYVFFE